MRSVLSIPLRPHRLADAAMAVPTRRAALVGTGAFAVIAAGPLSALSTASLDEPFPDALRFLWMFLPIMAALLLLIWGMLLFPLVLLTYDREARCGPVGRAILLSPLAVLAPGLGWPLLLGTHLLLWELGITAPELLHLLLGLAILITPLGLLILWAAAVRHAVRRAELLRDGSRCPRCLYDLRGLTSACCPECGGTLALHRTNQK